MNLGSCFWIKKSLHGVPEQPKTWTSINDKHLAKCLQN